MPLHFALINYFLFNLCGTESITVIYKFCNPLTKNFKTARPARFRAGREFTFDLLKVRLVAE